MIQVAIFRAGDTECSFEVVAEKGLGVIPDEECYEVIVFANILLK